MTPNSRSEPCEALLLNGKRCAYSAKWLVTSPETGTVQRLCGMHKQWARGEVERIGGKVEGPRPRFALATQRRQP